MIDKEALMISIVYLALLPVFACVGLVALLILTAFEIFNGVIDSLN